MEASSTHQPTFGDSLLHGDPWGSHGDPWGPMGPHGTPWGPIGTHWEPLGPMGLSVFAKNLPYVQSFGFVEMGEPLLYLDSEQILGLAINNGGFAG